MVTDGLIAPRKGGAELNALLARPYFRVTVFEKPEIEVPLAFSYYEVTIDRNSLPAKEKVIERI